MYLYLDATTSLYFADNRVLPAGKYILKRYSSDTIIEIISADTQKPVFDPIEITNIQKEDNSYYTDLDSILTGIGDLFK